MREAHCGIVTRYPHRVRLLAQPGFQETPSAVHPGHHRPDGTTNAVCDFAVRELFDICENNRGPKVLGDGL